MVSPKSKAKAMRQRSPPSPKDNGSGDMGEYMKAGFGLSMGSFAAFMLLTLIAMIFFIPGFIIVVKQNKKPKGERDTTWLVVGFVLMGLGMVIGLGFGAGAFFGELSSDL